MERSCEGRPSYITAPVQPSFIKGGEKIGFKFCYKCQPNVLNIGPQSKSLLLSLSN